MFDLVLTFLIISTIGMVAVIMWQAVQNRRQPLRRVRAVVLRKRTLDYSIEAPTNPLPYLINIAGWGIGRRSPRISVKHTARLSGEITLASSTDCLITFGVEGEEIELIVPEAVFMKVPDGTWGTLIHQGEIFKHFLLDPAAPNEPYRQGSQPPPSGKPLVP